MTDAIKLDAFTRAYLEAALWTSDPWPKSGGWCEHDDWAISMIDPASLQRAIDDCRAFQDANRADLDEVTAMFGKGDDSHGHDYWLTRNGHGAGFWGRGYGELGKRLTEASGRRELYVSGPELEENGETCSDDALTVWDRVIYIE